MTYRITLKRNGKVYRTTHTGPLATRSDAIELTAAILDVAPRLLGEADWSASFVRVDEHTPAT